MVDHATPNLPSRDLDATAAFYAALGFATAYHDPGWLILERGTLVLEFFPDPGMDPASTASSSCGARCAGSPRCPTTPCATAVA